MQCAIERGTARFLGTFEPGPVAHVVLDHPTREQYYDYLVPPELSSLVAGGSLVWVPSRNRRSKGWIVGFGSEVEGELKPISSVVAPFPLLSRTQLRLAAAAAEYYLTDIRRFLRRMTPPSVPPDPPAPDDVADESSVALGAAVEIVADHLVAEGYELRSLATEARRREASKEEDVVVVAHPPGLPPASALGRSFRRLREAGISSLVALGSVLVRDSRLVREAMGQGHVFVDAAAPARKRVAVWTEACRPGSMLAGDRAIVLHRARRLGLLSIVGESSPSHREDRIPYYNARTLGLLRGRIEGCPVVLTAAWPSYEARQAGTTWASIPPSQSRPGRPAVEVVDRSKEVPEPGFISSRSARRIRDVLEADGRVVLFVTKKGGFRSQRCRDCWFVLEGRGASACTRCGSSRLGPAAPGAAAIEAEAQRLFPAASISQLTKESGDFDQSASLIVATEAALWRLGWADMIVVVSVESLVGLVSFDAWFRSARILHDLVGLLGAPGRGYRRRTLLLQTYNPSHPVVDALLSGEESRLLEPDLAARAAEFMPPFSRAVLVESAEDAGRDLVDRFCEEVAQRYGAGSRLVIAGPHDEGSQRRALVVHDGSVSLWDEANTLRRRAKSGGTRVRIEVDPDASYRQL